ncbi:MAG TPA: hypothetical protein VE177_05425, partial [Candidatus Binatus sp.]|nr:hypothetical protein [Candidatus Binatus sp.]
MKKTRFWYDSFGRESQQDVYSGNTSNRSFYSRSFYDTWGNMIYSRDASGHERYQSYANTNGKYGFQSPGNLTTTTDGRIFYDDFNWPTPDSTLWYPLGGTATNKSLSTGFSVLTLRGASATSGTSKVAFVKAKTGLNFPVYLEVQMSLGSNPSVGTIDSDLLLSPGFYSGNVDPYALSNNALRISLISGLNSGIFKKVNGTETQLPSSYFPVSNSIVWKLIFTDRNTLKVFVNSGTGLTEVYSTTSLGLSPSFLPTVLYLSLYNKSTTTYSASFDYVGVSGSNTITVNGLQSYQRIELVDSNNVTLASAQATGQQTILNATSTVFPYASFRIYTTDGRTVQSLSPTGEVWGGSTYAYSQPFMSGG